MAITSAGAGSGLQLESVISASVEAKKAQLQQPIITKRNSTQITLSGIGQLKSSISAFTDILDKLSAPGAFNKRAINITQDKDDPVLKMESKSGGSNGQYNITVNKLATTSRQEGIFDSSTVPLVTQDGQLTFKAGDKFKEPDLVQVAASYLYSDGDGSHFMDQETYETHTLDGEMMGDALDFLVEGQIIRSRSSTATPSGSSCQPMWNWPSPTPNPAAAATRPAAMSPNPPSWRRALRSRCPSSSRRARR